MTSLTAWDEHGRLISEDGWYVWTGSEWALRSSTAPPPAVPSAASSPVPDGMPPPMAPAPVPPVSDGVRADIEAEAATYTGTRRLQRGSLRAMAAVLAPDEALLASATGTVQRGGAGLRAVAGTAGAALAQRTLVVAPTDRRLVLGVANVTGSSIDVAFSMTYEEITAWEPNIGRMGSLLTVSAADGTSVSAFQFKRDKLEQVDAVVAPRLSRRA